MASKACHMYRHEHDGLQQILAVDAIEVRSLLLYLVIAELNLLLIDMFYYAYIKL